MYLHNTGQSSTDSNGYIAGMLSASGSLWKGLSSSSRRSCGAKICRVGQLLVRPRSSATRCTTDFAKWLRQRSTAQSLSQDSCGMCMSTHRRRCQPWACEIPRRMYSARACQQIPKRIIRSEMRSAYRSHAQWPEKNQKHPPSFPLSACHMSVVCSCRILSSSLQPACRMFF